MVSNSLRIVGLLAMFVGLAFSLTGIGAIIGIPLILIGTFLFLPELFAGIAILIIFIILLSVIL